MKNKILLVEDNSELLQQHIDQVSVLGYESIGVSNFKELKNILDLEKENIFIVLHDHILANDLESNALDLLMQNDIPTIVFSEVYNENIAEETVFNGALDYVVNNEGIDYTYILQMIERTYKNQVVKAIVADGNKTARATQVNLLKKFNIDSFEAKNTLEIERLLQKNKDIGLVIVDQSLDGETGTDVILKLRKIHSKDNLAIIGVTEHGHSSRLAIEFLKKGANDFITKPFISEEFNLRVMQSLDTLEFIHVNKQSAMTDHLTQMYNKRAFESLGGEICILAKKEDSNVACAMLDIDFFKKINDTYGHHIGDKVLVSVSEIFKEHFRKSDLVARVGGEEFTVLLSNIKTEKVVEIFEEFRKKIESKVISTDNGDITVTISIGLYLSKEYILHNIVEKADGLLYDAKNSGRNKIKFLEK
ncbi:diguanylate cyclase [Sulfurimonas aquatica]|uniref:diguanylate cyclase n=1 Tax=Sulfurimonas aquatica TaxID=2672570 RepID=A0A975GD37_9BACT|nr:diguanylate cyclase [Sulfurimonas aquatica]QSZ42172.1 diguanylate cyclase [Sulfurimonas aquatica]